MLDDVTAVVVDWNAPDHTVRCVEALVGDGLSPGRIVVVENGATAANWGRISTELSDCVLVRIEENVGFAKAMNTGARVLSGSAYLLVNNDAFVQKPGSLSALVQALGREGVGIAVPRLLNEDLTLQPSVAPFTTPLTALVRASGLSRFLPNRWQPHLSTHWDHGRSREVEAAVGAVIAVEAAVWEKLGGLWETSFMYAEDLDLCWRARRDGWKTWFAADAEFVHLGGTSSDRRWSSRERAQYVARAEANMIRRQLSPARAAATLGLVRLGLAVRVAYFSLVGNSTGAQSCRGSLEGLRSTSDDQPLGSTGTAAVEVVQPRS
jgi:N-acetylglucosaminyl-diphospho-decaprenol L-rhamnosyltransferase